MTKINPFFDINITDDSDETKYIGDNYSEISKHFSDLIDTDIYIYQITSVVY